MAGVLARIVPFSVIVFLKKNHLLIKGFAAFSSSLQEKEIKRSQGFFSFGTTIK